MHALRQRAYRLAAVWIFFGALLAHPPRLFAQDLQSLPNVLVTGSAIPGLDSEALPITVIQAEALRLSGVSTAEEAVRLLSNNQSATGVSLNVGQWTGGRAEANLRALGANRTLVLLNGRRIANHPYVSGSVDLYSIPLAAIERIEVLRDGASAIYGTDAIGGVINFVTRQDYRGVDVAVEGRIPQHPGGHKAQATVSGGFGSLDTERFNVLGVIDVRHEDAIRAVDRDFASTGVLPEHGLLRTSGTTFPANLFQPSTGVAGNPSFPDCRPPESISNQALLGPLCRYDFVKGVDLVPENRQASLLGRATMRLHPDHDVSIEYMQAHNDVVGRTAPLVFIGSTMTPASPYFPGQGITPAIPGLDPTQNISVNWRSVPAGQRITEAKGVAERAVVQLEGSASRWEYRVGAIWSRDKVDDYFNDGFLDGAMIDSAFTHGTPVFINPFGDPTPAEQAFIDSAKILGQTIASIGEVTGADAVASTKFGRLPGGPVELALGAETRHEQYRVTTNQPQLIQAADGARSVSALSAEAIVPLSSAWQAQLAVRRDNYSDVGATTNPKVALRYRPSSTLTFRASANSGFRAPTLYEIHQPEAIGLTLNAYNDPLRCPGGVPAPGADPSVSCGQQVNVRRAGSAALAAEKSSTWTIGAAWQPSHAASFSLDYWDLTLMDQIGVVSEQAIFADPAHYAAKFVRCGQVSPALASQTLLCRGAGTPIDPLALAYIDTPNENLGDLDTRGVDVGAKYRVSSGQHGRVDLALTATYVTAYRYQRQRDGVFIDSLGRVVDTVPVFRWQHAASATWTRGNWVAMILNRYKSGYVDQNDPASITSPVFANHVGAYSIWDVAFEWTPRPALRVTAGVMNLFDTDPPFSNQGSTFQSNYDPRLTDPSGRTWRLRLEYSFR